MHYLNAYIIFMNSSKTAFVNMMEKFAVPFIQFCDMTNLSRVD